MAIGICLLSASPIIAQEETREVSGFNSISYSLPGNLEIYQGKTESLIIKGNADQLKEVITEVEKGVLKIYTECHSGNKLSNLQVVVNLRDLNELSLAGSGVAEVKTRLKTDSLLISLSGSGSITCMELEAKSAEVRLAGSGNILLGGSASGEVEINIAGSGEISTENLQASEGEVNISGSGSAKVNMTDELVTKIAGSGNVLYRGNPRIDKSVSGSGSVKQL